MNDHENYDRALVLATGAHAEETGRGGELAAMAADFAAALHGFAEELVPSEADVCGISNRMRALSDEIDQYSQWLRDEARAENAQDAP